MAVTRGSIDELLYRRKEAFSILGENKRSVMLEEAGIEGRLRAIPIVIGWGI